MAFARYTKQFAVVGTETQGAILKGVGEISTTAAGDKAPVVRFAVDQLAGLVDGELRKGDTVEDAIARVAALMDGDRSATVV